MKSLYKMMSLGLLILNCLTYLPLKGIESHEEQSLQEIYESLCQQESDIQEYLPILSQLAQDCASVTEISRSTISQWGILHGLSETLHPQPRYLCINSEFPPAEELNLAKALAEKNKIHFTFWRIHEMHIEMETTDMLFIDALHTYCHLTYELETFSPKVCKYICIHHTSGPWSHQNDSSYSGNYGEFHPSYERTKGGLWPAVEDFLNKHPEWTLLARHTNHQGFTILKRLNESDVHIPIYDPQVNDYLKNKIILCTGPALNNSYLLKKTTESDMQVIPFKKIYVSTNDPGIMDITFNNKKPICQLIPNQGKQLDCLNCIITTLKNVVNDPEVEDDDIVIFKHETVYINDMHLIKQAISKILKGYDMVARSWIVPKSRTRGTDTFFVKVSSVRDIVKDFPLVTSFTPDSTFCEEYFTAYIVYLLQNVYDVPYCHSNGGFTELGFYHITSWAESHRAPWDRSNYHHLFSQP